MAPRIVTKLLRNLSMRELGKKSPLAVELVEKTGKILPHLRTYLDQGLPISITWFDEGSELYATSALISLRTDPAYEHSPPIRYVPLEAAFEVLYANDVLVAFDYEKDDTHLRNLGQMLPGLKHNGASRVVYLSLTPEIHAYSLNGITEPKS